MFTVKALAELVGVQEAAVRLLLSILLSKLLQTTTTVLWITRGLRQEYVVSSRNPRPGDKQLLRS